VAEILAHISDLHLGRDAASEAAAEALCAELVAAEVDVVVATGDLTHRGRLAELRRFEDIFAPLAARLVVVPGNHDRLGDDLRSAIMPGPRVQAAARGGLWLISVDSTAPHNRSVIASHGALEADDLAALDAALGAAPPGALVVMALHHHLLPLPEEHVGERLAALLGWPHAAEIAGGPELVQALRRRCDLVLHGHRHRAAELTLDAGAQRPLRVLNAGSTPELGRARLLAHEGGRLVAQAWLGFGRAAPRPLPALARVAA
jgi:3',5'-cyclic-AMP phosphodiesterase